MPRDRLGEFASDFIDAYEHSTKPMDKLILQLYSKGMSTRDIKEVIKQLYGKELSPQAVTEITKEIEEERLAWEKRPLKKRYCVIFIDALFVKVRRDTVASDAVYIVAGIDDEGYRDILRQYVAGEESSAFWRQVLQDIKSRGVDEVLLFVFDGLPGLEETTKEIYPKSLNQLCVVHRIRQTISHVRASHKDAVAGDLKSIYRSKTLTQAKQRLLEVKSKW
jgi:transposase-like protein